METKMEEKVLNSGQSNELVEIETSKSLLEQKVKDIEIVSKGTLESAVVLTSDIKQEIKRAERLKEYLSKSLKEQIKKNNALCDPLIEKLESFEKELKIKIVTYQMQLEKQIRFEEERLRKIQEEKYRKEVIKAEKKDVPPPPPPPPIKIEQEKIEGLSMRKIWDFEIVDESKIQRDYLCVDLKKIGKVVRAGIRQIEGVRIFEKITSAVSEVDDL